MGVGIEMFSTFRERNLRSVITITAKSRNRRYVLRDLQKEGQWTGILVV